MDPPHVLQWKSVVGYWTKLSDMSESRVYKRIALWANSKSNLETSLDLHNYCNTLCRIAKYYFVTADYEKLMSMCEREWQQSLNNVKGKGGQGRNKLRIYCTYKQIFYVEKYCHLIMPY